MTAEALLQRVSMQTLLGIDLSLERMHHLLAALGNPHLKLPPVVHVAGTNGKGSTIAFIKAVCEAAGLHVHRYTSPHLVRFNERIEMNGAPVDDALLQDALKQIEALGSAYPATFFEATTAAAFLCFASVSADILLLEVGLGGRFDATNVLPNTLMSVIAPVDYDHQEFLGNDLTKIAYEKAGIMRENGVCVSAPQRDEAAVEIARVASEMNVVLHQANVDDAHGYTLGLVGEYQRVNAATALAVCRELQKHFSISDAHIRSGFANAYWPARLQRLTHGPAVDHFPSAEIYLDGGHNPHAAAALAQWLVGRMGQTHVWLAMRRGKDVEGFIKHIAAHVTSISTLPIDGCPDAYTPEELASLVKAHTSAPVHAYASVAEAVHGTNCDEKATILICGSLYLAGNILKDHG